MSFAEHEQGQGSPAELYRFALGQQTWRYTSAEDEIAIAIDGVPESFAPRAISRGPIQQPREVQKSSLKLTVARDLPVAQLFIGGALDQVMTLTIFRVHRLDAALQTLAIWKGRVLQASFSGVAAEMDCEPVFTSLRRMGLRRTFAAGCPLLLYGDRCGVDARDYRDTATVSSLTGTRVMLAGLPSRPAGWYTGGELVYQGQARRLILESDGNMITLSAPIPGLNQSALVDIYPGCDHALTTCKTKFNNLDNYGGFPFVPTQNPFGGQPII